MNEKMSLIREMKLTSSLIIPRLPASFYFIFYFTGRTGTQLRNLGDSISGSAKRSFSLISSSASLERYLLLKVSSQEFLWSIAGFFTTFLYFGNQRRNSQKYTLDESLISHFLFLFPCVADQETKRSFINWPGLKKRDDRNEPGNNNHSGTYHLLLDLRSAVWN